MAPERVKRPNTSLQHRKQIMKTSIALKTILGAAALTLPLIASAASSVSTGAGALTASATVNFTVTIPHFLYLRVGTGSSYTTGALTTVNTTDLINFNVAAGTVGNGTAVPGTGGDLTGGVETAAILGNGGNVTLTANATGALSNGVGDSIPFTQIVTSAAALTTGYTTLTPPQLSNGTTTQTITAAGKIVQADAKWTYSYANTVAAPAGTYGGTVANNGTVTYTATMP
jgi:hypothetical protein